MILCENFCTGARRAADVARTAAPGPLAAVAGDPPRGASAGSSGTGTAGRLPRQDREPAPGQGCCEAGKRSSPDPGDPPHRDSAGREWEYGTAPVLGLVTVMEAHLLAGLAHRQLGDQRAANQAAEHALALAEADRLILPFAMTGSAELLEALPRHQTAHAALLADILDVLHGSSPAASEQSSSPPAEELSPGELRVLRYLPTNLSRPEIAGELSVSPSTVSAHIRSIYAKLGVGDRSAAVRRARELRLLAAGRTR
jgi:LuxR family maltose regulon positive regulatory protein